ncbi:MAG: amino acid adenylation domain-containing protein, partial [bacterium]|nr:amino acid adenylation domain-containing protein [bacterium]
DGEKYLCAYYIPVKGDVTPASVTSDLKAHLSRSLPDYMVPAYFVPLEAFPLNSSGKIDKPGLPDPRLNLSENEMSTAPRDGLEKKIADIWSELLGIPRERIGRDSNFFRMGGHSLKATVLMSRLHKELNVVVPLAEIFNSQTIEQLAGYTRIAPVAEHASIEPAEQKKYYRLSAAQRRLFIVQHMDRENTGYNMPYLFPLGKDYDPERLENVLNKMILRHESLRTSFRLIDETPVQEIHDSASLEIESLNPEPGTAEVLRDFSRPFDLSQAPLLRAGLLKMETGPDKLLVDMHHIISDAVSQEILELEFNALYEGKELPPLALQYKDYSEWQNSHRQQQVLEKQEKFWLEMFPDELPVLDLPYDYPRPMVRSYRGGQFTFFIDREAAAGLKHLSFRTHTTLYMVLLSACNILFSKLSGQEDIIIGTPIANRKHIDLQTIIGMFVNTLAIRNYPTGGKTFREFLKEVKECTLKTYENQDYSFEALVDKVSVKRDTGRNPVFDILFNFLNQAGSPETLTDEANIGEIIEGGESKANYDIIFRASEMGEIISLNVTYCTALYKGETIKRFIGYFKRILTGMIREPDRLLASIDYVPEDEKNRILLDFNRTDMPFAEDLTIHRCFEEKAGQTPGQIAVHGEGVSLSYGELNHASHCLARQLKEKGVNPVTNPIVAIMADRSVETVIGILGILKAGGAYLPIDPGYPQERIDFMLKDSGAGILLNRHTPLPDPLDGERQPPLSTAAPSSLAYLIYTSGTTGRPKGVAVEHTGAVNTLLCRKGVYGLDGSHVSLQLFSCAFDGFVTSFFTPLISGARIVLPGEEDSKNVGRLGKAIAKHQVTHFICIPALFRLIIEALTPVDAASLQVVTLAGDRLDRELLEVSPRKCKSLEIAVEYGVTEAAVMSTIGRNLEQTPELYSVVGKPVWNTRLFILDRHFNPQPIGVAGELVISGAGLARGYLNRPELTAERFVNHKSSGSTNIYKTGDLARWLPDGNIQFLGRIDHQVKVSGFRIEPGEIERRLTSHRLIDRAVVLARVNENGGNELRAYIAGGNRLVVSELREFLAATLPDYMIPSRFTDVKEIPLTPSGKVNRGALEILDNRLGTGVEYVAPRNDDEENMVAIWKEVLQLEQIGIHENFFDLGGTSLDIIKLNTRFTEVFNEEDRVMEMFRYPTISSFAGYLANKREGSAAPGDAGKRSLQVKKIKKGKKSQKTKRKGIRNV